MSDDFKLPDLPSDEELGIDDEDLHEFVEDEGSELTEAEMKALLGEATPSKAPPSETPKKKSKKKGKKGKGLLGGLFRRKAKDKGSEPPTNAPPAKKPPPADPPPETAPPKAAPPRSAPREDAPAGARGDTPPGKDAPPGDGEPPKKERKAPPSPEAEGPRTRWKGPATLVVLLLTAWLGSTSRAVPRPVPANAPETAFSSARAMAHVVEIARTAHPPGSPEHDRVRSYLVDELSDLGLEPQIQTVTSMIGRDGYVRGVTARNILARIPGTESTGAVLVTAHYDGRGLARAAGDDGAGVVSILESLRALRAGEPLQNDLIVLITDAEELGLLGARGFVDEHPWMDDIQAVISVEMRGGAGPSIMFETGAEYGWILDRYAEAAPRPYANSLTYEIYRRMPNDTDFTPFVEAGKQGLNFAAIGRAHVYHQVYDDPENLSEGTLQHHGLNTLSSIRMLGSADLRQVNAPNKTYFSVPFVGLITYPEDWTWPITGIVVLAWVAILVLARARGLSLVGAAVGLIIPAVTMGAAWAVGSWAVGWLAGFHPETGSLHGSAFHSEGWYILSLVALCLTVLTTLWGLARMRFDLRSLAVGASLLVVPLVAGVTYLVPMGAMNLQWPALAFLVSLGTAMVLPAAGKLRHLRWLVAILGAGVVAVLLTSLVELIWLAMSIRLASALGVVVVLILTLMLPALDSLREPNSWFAPALGALLTGIFLGVGILQADPSPERPLPSTLIYALDNEAAQAQWATAPAQGSEDASLAWAETQAGSAFTTEATLQAFTGNERSYAVAEAPLIAPPQPMLSLDGSVLNGDQRLVRVSVRSTLNAEMLRLEIPAGVRVFSLNGKAIPEMDSVGVIEHWGRPDSAVVLDMGLPASDSVLAFTLVEHTLRPGELLGAEVFRRPPDQAPDIVRLSDRAMIRTLVRFSLDGEVGAVPIPGAAEAGPGGGSEVGEEAPTATVQPDTAAPADTTALPDTTAQQPDTTAADTTTTPGALIPPDTAIAPDTTRSGS